MQLEVAKAVRLILIITLLPMFVQLSQAELVAESVKKVSFRDLPFSLLNFTHRAGRIFKF